MKLHYFFNNYIYKYKFIYSKSYKYNLKLYLNKLF